jgi:hypothetical protein
LGRIFHFQEENFMISVARITANRENAQHSTGPRTEAGKARISRNAFKHGLSAVQVALTGEDLLEYKRIVLENRIDLAPARAIQEALCDQISYTEWKLLRIAKWETEIIDASLVGRTAPSMALFGDTPAKALERLHRYEAQLRRGMHQNLRALGRLQKDDSTNPSLAERRHEIIHNMLKILDLSFGPETDGTNPTAPAPPPQPGSQDSVSPEIETTMA